jgi:hypothetical protein
LAHIFLNHNAMPVDAATYKKQEQIPASSINLTSKLKRRERGINQVRRNQQRCAK